ncbi:MAG: putative basic amino acid antiporter YfcC [Acidobacteria bacterium]|nr:putative basic amino acid antiporter YfcC [Acidobacteriota bacterium]
MHRTLLERVRVPHVFPLLLGVILACSVLTYVLPSGAYERRPLQIGETTRSVVVPGTYRSLPKAISPEGILTGRSTPDEARPTSLVGFLTAVPRGLESSGDIIFLIFLVGGVFGILHRTGTITALLQGLLERFGRSGRLLTVILMTVVAIGGSTLGMGEELIPLVPLFLLVSRRLGYDRVFGVALVFVSAAVGFAAATTNPFNVQIAQGIAGVPLGSGIGFRLVFFACALVLAILHVLRYGERVRRDPSRSLVAGEDIAGEETASSGERLRATHVAILVTAAVIFAVTLYAIQTQGWWLAELSGGFLLIGLAAAAISRLSIADATTAFVKGMEDMVVAALVVGFARGIQVVLDDARVLDTIVFGAAQVLQMVPNLVAAEGMLVFQTILNFFIPSGSGQAAVTMPLMAPLADVLGLTRQIAVFAFTCGDGFSNMVIPTSGILMAMLGVARVPYDRWLRFVLPLFVQLILLSALFLAIGVWIGY